MLMHLYFSHIPHVPHTIRAFIVALLFIALVLVTAPKWTQWANLPTIDPRIVRCSDFRTQPSAQARYLSDPIAYHHLDADMDSRACESLPVR